MGFRSTLVSEDSAVSWPEWFKEKYAQLLFFGRAVIASQCEAKTYGALEDLPEDIRKAIDWTNRKNFVLVYLHECGGISRCQIERDAVRWTEPRAWEETDGVTHDYCYGCSDATRSE